MGCFTIYFHLPSPCVLLVVMSVFFLSSNNSLAIGNIVVPSAHLCVLTSYPLTENITCSSVACFFHFQTFVLYSSKSNDCDKKFKCCFKDIFMAHVIVKLF